MRVPNRPSAGTSAPCAKTAPTPASPRIKTAPLEFPVPFLSLTHSWSGSRQKPWLLAEASAYPGHPPCPWPRGVLQPAHGTSMMPEVLPAAARGWGHGRCPQALLCSQQQGCRPQLSSPTFSRLLHTRAPCPAHAWGRHVGLWPNPARTPCPRLAAALPPPSHPAGAGHCTGSTGTAAGAGAGSMPAWGRWQGHRGLLEAEPRPSPCSPPRAQREAPASSCDASRGD